MRSYSRLEPFLPEVAPPDGGRQVLHEGRLARSGRAAQHDGLASGDGAGQRAKPLLHFGDEDESGFRCCYRSPLVLEEGDGEGRANLVGLQRFSGDLRGDTFI